MKKSVWSLISNIVLLLISTSAVTAFFILTAGGEPVRRWIPALIFSLIFGVLAIMGIKDYCTEEK